MKTVLKLVPIGAFVVVLSASAAQAQPGARSHHKVSSNMRTASVPPFDFGIVKRGSVTCQYGRIAGIPGYGLGRGCGGYPFGLGYFGYFYPRVDWQYWFDYYRIPYYAKHPPVYYSYPVPRTYGYSPYAYPPGTQTPEVVKPEPLTIQNRFVPRKVSAEPSQDQVTAAPLRIRNIYVAQAEAEFEARQAMVLMDPHIP